MDAPSRDRRLLRFSVATLLFLMLCLGGVLAGYRWGFEKGLAAATDTTVLVKSYSVADLVAPPGVTALTVNFDPLIDTIVNTVAPRDWMEAGTGEGEIQPFPTKLSLVISQTQTNHERIAALLEGLRKMQKNSPAAATAVPAAVKP